MSSEVEMIPIAEILHSELGAQLPGIQGVIYGAAVTAVILAAPEGLYWKLRDKIRRQPAVRSQTGGEVTAPGASQTISSAPVRTQQQREAAEQAERNAMQGGLFDLGGGEAPSVQYAHVPPWGERERLLQAMCPGNFSTSGTISVAAAAQALPHTPFPLRMRVQATGPWKGPNTSSSPFTR